MNGPLLVIFSTLPHPVFHFFESADSPPHQSAIRIKAFKTKRGTDSFHYSLLPPAPPGGQGLGSSLEVDKLTNSAILSTWHVKQGRLTLYRDAAHPWGNSHGKLLKETWSNLNNARGFPHHYLPGHALACVDLDALEKFSTIFYREMWYYTSFFPLVDKPGPISKVVFRVTGMVRQ